MSQTHVYDASLPMHFLFWWAEAKITSLMPRGLLLAIAILAPGAAFQICASNHTSGLGQLIDLSKHPLEGHSLRGDAPETVSEALHPSEQGY